MGRDDRDRPLGSLAQLAAVQNRDQQITELSQQISQRRSKTEAEWLESEKSQLPVEAIAAIRTPPKERNSTQNQLIQKHAVQWQAEITAAMPDDRRQQIAEIEQSIQKLRQQTPDLPRGYFLFEDSSDPPPTFLLLSGRASNPGPQMQPAVPVVLTSSQPSMVPVQGQTSGRRLALARWLVDPANPLTARVIVNRVWQHHFGEGIVATPSDFGQIGARPTHPELLDWLSDWFVHHLVPMLEVLDLCDTTNSTEKRSVTSIAPQALTLYNGEFMNSQASFFADRLIREVGDDPDRQIDRAYRLALCRSPKATELQAMKRFLIEETQIGASKPGVDVRRAALIQICRVILNLNEFVYVE